MKIWIDADSCPSLVREFVIESAKRKNFVVFFVSNHEVVQKTEHTEMIICEKGKDSADNYIFNNVVKNDIVITRDLLFAERLVNKGICVLNDRGISFTKDNIQDRLMERNLSLNLSEIGFGGNKKSQYSQKELKKFAVTFEYELQKCIINENYNIQ